MSRFPPLLEIVLGTLPLLAALFIHGAGMNVVQWGFRRHRRRHAASSRLHNGIFFAVAILIMVVTHLSEIGVWAAALIGIGAIESVRDAYYYVAGTYTTLGYGEGTLPRAVAADGADDRDLGTLRVRLDDERADEPRRTGERGSRRRGKARRGRLTPPGPFSLLRSGSRCPSRRS